MRTGLRSLRRPSLTDSLARRARNQPWALLALIALLLCGSLLCVQSASWVSSTGRYAPYAQRQLVWVCVGMVAFVAVQLVPFAKIMQLAPMVYLTGLGALSMVFVVGTTVNGSRRWFSLGSIRVQPSEFMKLALVLILARVIAHSDGLARLRSWLLPTALTAIPFALVLKQPDLGTSLTFLPVLGIILFLAGARLPHIALVGSAGLASLPLAWTFVLRGYQKMRILSFLDPEAQAQAGAYQQLQAIIAIGNGGLFGTGYEQGTQGRLGFCPERHTDFIFAVVGEEFGLLGGLTLLTIYLLLCVSLLRRSQSLPNLESRLVVAGVAAVFAMQVVVNVAMNTGVGPITGLTLPLMSYGGSSMLSSALALGLVAAAMRQPKPVFR